MTGFGPIDIDWSADINWLAMAMTMVIMIPAFEIVYRLFEPTPLTVTPAVLLVCLLGVGVYTALEMWLTVSRGESDR